ncbi:hypothetical protein BCR44DRAFT_1430634 [Catenaria anguillulae PL171]|uniref:Pyridoxal phosphate homeostasis protein n=1 Tax=Catenaria anguillulae PL171 TaxID=765915 RepID=A0A1Y2HVL6_9FUNG|nr:hypothetical protein BCR44DRAFT_1430634 [Catenaria anguillulae PL171]
MPMNPSVIDTLRNIFCRPRKQNPNAPPPPKPKAMSSPPSTAPIEPATAERSETLKANFDVITSHLTTAAQAADRSPADVRLVAVSKTKPASDILSLHTSTGHLHFGENYVQELVEKAAQLPSTLQWHFIGHVQSNKAKLIAPIPNLYVVETLDSAKLAKELNKHRAAKDGLSRLKVFVQVNTSAEDSKSGIKSYDQLAEIASVVVDECPSLQLAGLMTIGEPGMGERDFSRLAEWAGKLEKEGKVSGKLELSMGMSDDYELAIKHGSTNVRVGSALFGARMYPPGKGPKA